MKVRVHNVPMISFVSADVEVPDGLDPESPEMQEAIKESLLDKGYTNPGDLGSESLDEETIKGGWEFDLEPVKKPAPLDADDHVCCDDH